LPLKHCFNTPTFQKVYSNAFEVFIFLAITTSSGGFLLVLPEILIILLSGKIAEYPTVFVYEKKKGKPKDCSHLPFHH